MKLFAIVLALITFNVKAQVTLLEPAPTPATYTGAASEAQGFNQDGTIAGICVYTKRVTSGRTTRIVTTAENCSWNLDGSLLSAAACTYNVDCWLHAPKNAPPITDLSLFFLPQIIATNAYGTQVGYRMQTLCATTGTLTLIDPCDPIAVEVQNGSVIDLPLTTNFKSFALNINDAGTIVGVVDSKGFIYTP